MREPTEFEESEYLAEIEGERGRQRPPVRRMGQMVRRPGAGPSVRLPGLLRAAQLFQNPQLRPGAVRTWLPG